MSDDSNTNISEILSGQLRQDLGVNLVLLERLLVALQPSSRSQAAMFTISLARRHWSRRAPRLILPEG
jgi:hypothetical protein